MIYITILVIITQSCMSYVHNGVHMTFRSWDEGNLKIQPTTTEKPDLNWIAVKKVLDQMAPHLEKSSIVIPTLSAPNGKEPTETVQFLDVVVVNWLSDVIKQCVTTFNTLDSLDDHESDDRNYEFKLDEKVIIVNFTIPQILFSGRFLFNSDGKQGAVHCAMDKMAVGMFVHFSKSNNIVYVDNFQMQPPENYVLTSNDEEIAGNKGYVNENDRMESEWKLAIWLTINKLIEDYLKDFMLTDDSFFT
ncbi:uncharacterized protein [Atheta coriaria]|uniref:uncharacterized protein isoform X2 n=1 Tax=Dalotia coriaria TaxID=877792 RepID=UPI0031F38548